MRGIFGQVKQEIAFTCLIATAQQLGITDKEFTLNDILYFK